MEDNRRPTDVTLTEWAILDAAREAARLYDIELSEKLAAQWAAEDAAEMALAA
jgi:hypothetical protein